MFRRSKFVSSASTLIIGTVAAQLVTFLFSFILTRLYTASEYGHFSFFMACGTVLVALGTGSYEKVILLSKSNREAQAARYIVAFISISVAIIILVLGLLLASFGIFNATTLKPLDFILLPAFVVFFAGSHIFNYSNLREGRMTRIAIFKAAQSLVSGGMQALLSSLKIFPGLVVGYICGLLLLTVASTLSVMRAGRGCVSFRVLFVTARRNYRYPRYIMPNEIVDTFSNQAPVLLISAFLSLSATGYYSLALMTLSAPAALVGQAVSQTFLQYVSRQQDDPAAIRRAMIYIWMVMAALGLLPFGLITLFGEHIFIFAFGTKWAEAGAIAALFAPFWLVRFSSSPTSSIYLKLNMQRAQWYFVLVAACCRVAAYLPLMAGVDLSYCIGFHAVGDVLNIIFYNKLALSRLKALASDRRSRSS